jgi:hypothetical protein
MRMMRIGQARRRTVSMAWEGLVCVCNNRKMRLSGKEAAWLQGKMSKKALI